MVRLFRPSSAHSVRWLADRRFRCGCAGNSGLVVGDGNAEGGSKAAGSIASSVRAAARCERALQPASDHASSARGKPTSRSAHTRAHLQEHSYWTKLTLRDRIYTVLKRFSKRCLSDRPTEPLPIALSCIAAPLTMVRLWNISG